MINELLLQRKLPPLLTHVDGTPVTKNSWEQRREEILDLLAEYEYGRMPALCGKTTAKIREKSPITSGEYTQYLIDVTFPTPDGESFTFPARLSLPNTPFEPSLFIYIAFKYDEYFPLEEILEHNVAVASFIYTDVTDDRDDGWTSGIAPHYIKDGVREADQWGKIGMWAFAASRLLDVLKPESSKDRIVDCHFNDVGVIGHSRLGKTALWAAANDCRFTHVFPNNSGCAGVALSRGKVGEQITRIATTFPYWFCENMQTIAPKIESTAEDAPFDQHFLVAAIAPRRLYTGTAILDSWADCYSEYLSLWAASPVWNMLQANGLLEAPDYLPQPGEIFDRGRLAYFLRKGGHALSRPDWLRYINFLTLRHVTRAELEEMDRHEIDENTTSEDDENDEESTTTEHNWEDEDALDADWLINERRKNNHRLY